MAKSTTQPTNRLPLSREVNEIATRTQAGEMLLKAGALQKAIFDSANFSSIATDAKGVIQIFNVGAERMLGYTAADVMNKITPADLSDPQEIIARAEALSIELGAQITPGFEALVFKASRGIEDIYELTYIRKDGSRFPAVVSVTALRDADNEIIGYLLIGTDNTARKRIEETLSASEEFKSSMIDNSNDCIKVIDREGVLKYMSSGGQKLLEIEDINKYLDKSWVDFWNEEDRKAVRVAISTATQGEVGRFQAYSPSEKGTPKWWDVVITPIRDATGTVNTLLAVSRDITEHKRAEQEIHQLNTDLEERVHRRTAELEAANNELEAFAYSVSHDLRAPLRAIDGFSRKVVMGYGDKLDDEGRRQLQVVRDNAQSMGQLIDDLLAFSRMGRREMALQPLDMDAMVKGVADELRATEPQRVIEFTFSPLPRALGDAAMLRQVWVNLLANAAKFSHQRQVAHIEVGGRTENGEALYWVKDDGAGFDMQYANKLFGVFQRLHRQDEFEGTGVGLAIVQRILHRHNGRIWGEGKPDAGATFSFALPINVNATHLTVRGELVEPPVTQPESPSTSSGRTDFLK